MSYQNSIVLNEKIKPEKNPLFLPSSQSFLTTQVLLASKTQGALGPWVEAMAQLH